MVCKKLQVGPFHCLSNGGVRVRCVRSDNQEPGGILGSGSRHVPGGAGYGGIHGADQGGETVLVGEIRQGAKAGV